MAIDIPVVWATDGDISTIPTTTQPDGSASFQEGWSAFYQQDPETSPTAKRLSRANYNYLFNLLTANSKEFVSQGIPNHIVDKEYNANDMVRGTDGKNYKAIATTTEAPPHADWIEDSTDTKLFATAGGTANALTVTIPAITEYAVNSTFRAKATLDNTGATTINVNGLGAKNVVIGNTALSGGEIVSGNEYFLTYSSNGNFELTDFNQVETTLPTFLGTATFTATDNKIVMTGIVTSLGLEKGDVIQFTSGTDATNAKIRTVEIINSDDEIIVNYEHSGSRGNGSLKLSDQSSISCTVKRLSKWYNASVGFGQEWVDLTAIRSVGVAVTDTTGKPIEVFLFRPLSSTVITIDSVSGTLNTSSTSDISFIVPNNSSYSVSKAVATWLELR